MCLLVVCAVSVAELPAQTTSSSAQVVTFGVRRIALQVSTASNVANTMSHSPVKVTIGSAGQFHSVSDLKPVDPNQTVSSQEPAVSVSAGNQRSASETPAANRFSSRLPITKSFPAGQMFVTITE